MSFNEVSVPTGESATAGPDAVADPTVGAGATYPPYLVEGKINADDKKLYFRELIAGGPFIPFGGGGGAAPAGPVAPPAGGGGGAAGKSLVGAILPLPPPLLQPAATPTDDPYAPLRAIYGADSVYPSITVPPGDATTGGAEGEKDESNADAEQAPYDPRLIFVKGANGNLVYSFTALENVQTPLVEGMITEDQDSATMDNGDKAEGIVASEIMRTKGSPKRKQFEHLHAFYGVPSIMNDNMYTNLPAAGGLKFNKLLRDLENQPRWYDITAGVARKKADGQLGSSTMQLTIKDIVDWSQVPKNAMFPYRFQDFVFLKYWKKIPLNYMITLRRYTRPVIDNATSIFDEKKIGGKGVPNDKKQTDHISQLGDAARAITFLGEEAGNKISTILGPITAGLKWKEIKAGVHNIAGGSGGSAGSPGTAGDATTPFPGVAKLFDFILGGSASKPAPGGSGAGGGGSGTPKDPYNNGPYANKLIGPITVIESTKARDRGVEFKHTIKLTFEYAARSIGGINSKAALLDILGNMMILTFNEASFWGGYNRHMPSGGGGGGGGSGGGECFIDGTLIDMADGAQKQIEHIEVGDIVLTYNLKDQAIEPQKVLELKKFQKSNIIKIALGNGNTVSSTDEHPYYVVGKGWSSYNVGGCKLYNLLFVEQLSVGDFFLGNDGKEVEVLSIDYVETDNVNVTTFEVFGNHNYYANGILVHNKGGSFLGGKEGKEAWMRGDPEAFFGAVVKQFNSVMDTVGDFFKELQGDPVATLMGAAKAGASKFMKLNQTGGSGGGGGSGGSAGQALHALLTGDAIGEWHVTVGNPQNPMMLIGNLICTGITINFNDELGPDDFPTEAKFEVTLDHGMPRDRAAIEGMFNKGNGRIYSFPPGIEENEVFSSYNQSAVDRSLRGKGPQSEQQSKTDATTSANTTNRGTPGSIEGTTSANLRNYDTSQGGNLKHLVDDPGMWGRSFGYAKQTLGPTLRLSKSGFLVAGWSHFKAEPATEVKK